MRLLGLGIVVSAVVVTGSGGQVVQEPQPVTAALVPTTVEPAPNTGQFSPETAAPDPRPFFSGLSPETLPAELTLVAMMESDTEVFASPGALEPTRTLPATTIIGTPTVLAIVEGPAEGWARVMLPGRPNSSEGWVETEDALIYVVEGELVVDLSDKILTYYEGGEAVLTTTVAIGTYQNPTPTGHFFVTDNVTLADPNSPWGPHAFGLSARSDTITEYRGGDGIIGIHGTRNSSSIGQAASLGCLRLPNDVITRLHEMIPIGTPVVINA